MPDELMPDESRTEESSPEEMPSAPGTSGLAAGWMFAAGNIPSESSGREPEFTSREELCLLNTTGGDACVSLYVYHNDREPVGPYRIEIPARRVRHVRINDLIDPQAVPLDAPYAMVLISDVALMAQVRHVDTRRSGMAIAIQAGTSFEP